MNLLKSSARVVYRTCRGVLALPMALRLAATHSLPERIFSYGGGLGDDLLCTSIFRELKKRGKNRLGMISRYPEIFLGNRDFEALFPYSENVLALARMGIVDVRVPWYTMRDPQDPQWDRDLVPDDHIIALLCAYAGVEGEVALRPYWHFQDAERDFGKLGKVQIAIQSTGLSKDAKMPLKEWFPARFQEVVDRLSPSVTFVQLGRSTDEPLRHVIDLRGKTSVRETAAVLANSTCFVGLVGFLMHLARAVDCRSVIVYGGREAPSQSGYPANINLYSPEACAPCWRWLHCEYGRICMDRITPAEVVAGVERVLDERLAELPVETRQVTSREAEISRAVHLYRLSLGVRRRFVSFPPGRS